MGIRLTVFSAWSQKTEKEITYQFDQGRFIIGRSAGCDIRLPDRTVSETHAFIRLESAGYVIIDNSSTNGTAVNGVRIIAGRPKPIGNGDLIEIGEYVLTVQTGVAVALPTSAEGTASMARRLVREFRMPSEPEIQPPRLTILNGPQAGQFSEIPPPPTRLIVGRAEGCQLFINDPDVSREHMEVVRDLDGVLIRNLDSKNGVVIANQSIYECRLKNGTEIELGSTRLRFDDPADDSIQALSYQPDMPTSRRYGKAIALNNPSQSPAVRGTPGSYHARPPDYIDRSATSRITGSLATADILIYLLAAIVTVSSIVGLVVLLTSD
jgi:pSer/pThr/pTyr-binding forkhead associated (FHA) protein